MNLLLKIWKDRSGGPAIAALGPVFGAISSAVSIVSGVAGLFGGKKDKGSSAPAVPEIPTILDAVPKKADPKQAQDRSRRRAAAAVGRGKTVLTSPLGLDDDGGTARTTLLGK